MDKDDFVESVRRRSQSPPIRPPKKVATREDLDDQVKKFLASGGTIDSLGQQAPVENIRRGLLSNPLGQDPLESIIGDPP